MKKKVYVVTINEVSKFEQFDHDPVVFYKIEDARKFLSDAKNDAIGEYYEEGENDIRIDKDTENYFALFSHYEGWSHTHYEVSICECEIQ